MTGLIFDIQRASFVDGEGVRTAIFFKGCNLKCQWCHNPEGINSQKELLFYKDKCTDCGICKDACQSKTLCLLCGECALACPNDAKELCGKEYTLDTLMEIIERDRPLYERTGGGVTLSGGECLLQIDFAESLLKECHKRGINTAVDTAGNVPFEYFERAFPYTCTFLFDVKCASRALHKKFTGAYNDLILENLDRLLKMQKKVLVRIPVVDGFNNTKEEMLAVFELLKGRGVQGVELLPYHSLGVHKYEALSLPCKKFISPTKEQLEGYRALFDGI